MQQEHIDRALFDTLTHLSGYVINEEVEEKVRTFSSYTAIYEAAGRLKGSQHNIPSYRASPINSHAP